MIVQYDIVYDNYIDSLIKKVNLRLAEGWSLRGDLDRTGRHEIFTQVMTRDDPKPRPTEEEIRETFEKIVCTDRGLNPPARLSPEVIQKNLDAICKRAESRYESI